MPRSSSERYGHLPNRFLVYGLRDPRTQEIRYIGKSTKGPNRPKEHQAYGVVYAKADSHLHRNRWLRRLWEAGLKCEVVILQVCSSNDEVNHAEQTWIAIGKAAGTLTNVTDGGDGTWGRKPSPETLEKMRQANLGKTMSPEAREKLSRAHKGRIVSEDTRAKLRAATRSFLASNPSPSLGRKHSPDTRWKMALAATGRRMSPEAIEKRTATRRSRPASQRMIEACRRNALVNRKQAAAARDESP